MTGPCVYGHIITNEHIDHFRGLYPDTEESQSSDPESLVSVASVTISELHMAHTATVYDDQGDQYVCLTLVDHRDRSRFIDLRWTDDFMNAVKAALGITGKPDWYPCYCKRL